MVSIILPVYQVEDYIEKCLDSLTEQTYKDIEIICVNDCSMDNSNTIIKEYQKKDSRIRLINHEENRGLGGARNTGIEKALGEYIVFIDSDDYIDTTMIEKMVNTIINDYSDAVVCGVMLAFDATKTFQPHTAFQYVDLGTKEIYYIEQDKEILTDMWPSAWNKLYKTAIIQDNCIRFKEKLLYEDHTFFYEYFSHCKTFSYIEEPLYYYRQQRPRSITTQSVGREKEIFTILGFLKDIFDDMYSEDESKILFARITVRLLYERRWVFSIQDKNYYCYLKSVYNYLSGWNKDFLLKHKDTFIDDNDPIFLSLNEITDLEKKVCMKSQSKNFSFKNLIRRLPVIKQYISTKNSIIKYKNDFYWYISNIFDTVKDINNQAKNIEQLVTVQKQKHYPESSIDEIKLNIQNISEQVDNLKTFFDTNKIQENRISNIEKNITLSKGKIDEIWWLTWNIKDHLPGNEIESSKSELLKFYPTWIPTRYPEYFHGNVWHWADKFKEYLIKHMGDCSQELEILFYNLSESDSEYLSLLWERNTRILPYANYTEMEGFLIKRDLIFTKEELNEQAKILNSFTDITSNYILPADEIYEIPVFYYEHGIKALSSKYLTYVMDGDILDLGGFIGDSALVLSKYTSYKVYTIEMNKKNIEKLEMVLNMNHITDKIVPIHGAVADEDTIMDYYGENSYSTLNNMQDDELYELNERVNVYRIDSLVDNYLIRPHLLKMDVEGAEYKAILGAKDTIFKYRPILCISIYHTPEDFLYIKPLIESWDLGYTFHIENHNPFDPVYEKMLIALPQINIAHL